MSIKVGITGGIGSGKSVVSQLLRIMDIPVYDSDSEAKRLIATDAEIKQRLIRLFGEPIYLGGALNRALLSQYIFNNTEYLQQVNAIVHPVVKRDFINWCDKNAQKSIVGFESAILYESGFSSVVDKIITVNAPTSIRLERAIRRDHAERAKIESRIQHQMSDEKREQLADFTIINDNAKPLIPQVLAVLNALR